MRDPGNEVDAQREPKRIRSPKTNFRGQSIKRLVSINTMTDVAASDNSIELMFPTGMESILHENQLSPFRILLFDFSEELTRQDVEKMKYLALDFIPRGRAENIENGLHLFDALERNARISPQNLDLLEELLIKIGRKDLSAKVDKFRQGKCTFPCYELV